MNGDGLRPAASARLLVEFANRRGLSIAACLRGTGLGRADLSELVGRVPAWAEMRILRNVVAGLPPSRTLGSELGRQYHLTACGVAGLGLMAAPNIRAGLTFVADFHRMFHSICRARPERSAVRLDADRVPSDLRDLILDRDIALMLNAVEDAGAPRDAVLRVELEREGYPSNRIVLDPRAVQLPLRQSNETAFRDCVRRCTRQLDHSRVASTETVSHVWTLFQERPGSLPSLSQVAAELLMSERTLRRRLDESGTTYRALLGEFRTKTAIRLLGSPAMSVAEVGERVGYSEPAAFVRAFKAHTGLTPHRYRVEQGGTNSALASPRPDSATPSR